MSETYIENCFECPKIIIGEPDELFYFHTCKLSGKKTRKIYNPKYPNGAIDDLEKMYRNCTFPKELVVRRIMETKIISKCHQCPLMEKHCYGVVHQYRCPISGMETTTCRVDNMDDDDEFRNSLRDMFNSCNRWPATDKEGV